VRDEYQEAWLKEHRWKVVGATVAVLGLVTTFAIRWAKDRQIEADQKTVERMEYQLRHPPAPSPVMAEGPPPAPPEPPVRFELAVGREVTELATLGALIDAGGTEVVVRPLAEATFVGGGLSFRHPAEVSVSLQADRSVVAAIDGAALVLAPLARDESEVAPGFPGTGADSGPPEPVKRPMAGADRDGLRHRRSSGVVIETFAVELFKGRVGVILYRDGETRPIAPLDEILRTLAVAGDERAAAFDLAVGDKMVRAVALGAPVSLAGKRSARVVVRQRPTVRRAIGALAFEHPWPLAVSPVASDAVTSVVVLRGRAVAIRLVVLPMAMGVGAARSSLIGQAEAREEEAAVEATFGADEVRGKRYALTAEGQGARAELFVLRRGGKHIGAAVFYGEAEQGDALALAEPVLASVR
jgi:hypothetical protein